MVVSLFAIARLVDGEHLAGKQKRGFPKVIGAGIQEGPLALHRADACNQNGSISYNFSEAFE
jgi:hypothetical protein